MALADDFGLHVSLHLQHLSTLDGGVPSGLEGQCAEVSAIVAAYDGEVAAIDADPHLSAEGKRAKLKASLQSAQDAVGQWRAKRTAGIDAQSSAQRSALQSHADALLPKPTDLQVQTMVQRLAAFDPLEVEVLYSDATDAERRVMEVAAESMGRQPRKRGEQLVWEPLVPAHRVEAAVSARLAQANPPASAALHDAQRIRNTYEALAGSAATLLRQRLPAYVGA